MTAHGPPGSPEAADPLAAVTDPLAGEGVREGLERLLDAASRVTGAAAAVLQALDARSGRLRLVAVVGLGAAAGSLDGVLPAGLITGRAVVEDEEVETDGSDPRGVPDAVRDEGLVCALALPVRGRDRVIGALLLAGTEPLAPDPVRRHAARVAAERAGWLIERAQLYESLERAMAQILETDERMLGRVGLDIHDGPTQQLSVALLEVQLLEAELDDAEAAGAVLPDKLRPALGRIYETLGGALHEMRELIGHLRPAQFENRTLPEILNDAVRAFEARSGSEATFTVEGVEPDHGISLSQKITFYRILQEALTNAHRHGDARHAAVRLVFGPKGTQLEVQDDGAGFDSASVPAERANGPRVRFGLSGMRDRAQLLGGIATVTSTPGAGTLVRVFLPLWRPPDPANIPGLDRS